MNWSSLTVEQRDGRSVVVKHTDYDARLEAEGLQALAAAGGLTPGLLDVDRRRLVMEHVSGTPDWHAFASRLAAIHVSTAEAFGWHEDNRIGGLVQPNGWWPDWPEFYVERRIRPFVGGLPAELRARIDAACEGPLQDLLDHDVQPSLIHGDLWGGNVVDGCWLIDPAVCFADRELDLAFSTVFGGFPQIFYSAYEETWPLDDGWRERRPALQLYHLLVHVKLFGSSYHGAVASRIDALRW